MAYSIDPELLKEIQVTGITEADYERAAKYKEDIEHVESLFYEVMYIYDLFKMNFFCVSPQGKNYFNIAKYDLDDYVFNHISDNDNIIFWNLMGKYQEFVKLLPEKERKNYVFYYANPIERDGVRTILNYKSRVLETASDGRIWLAGCALILSPNKETGKLTAHNVVTGEIMEYDIKVNQWVMAGKITLTEAEKTVLRLSAQGLTISEIEKLLHRSKSTIDTHRKSIFKKLKASSMIEAIGYAKLYRAI